MKIAKLLSLFVVFISFPALAELNIIHPKGNIEVTEITKSIGTKIELLKEKNSAQFILLLPRAMVVNEGGIVTSDGKILKTTQTSKGDQHRLLTKNRDISTENPLYFKGRLAVISSPGSENWYHWLLQVLPRIKILKESGIYFDKIYINNLQYRWQKESLFKVLKFLGIAEDKLLLINGDGVVQAELLIVPSVPFIPAKGTPLPHWQKDFLSQVFLPQSVKNSVIEKKEEKFYISRSKAKIRRIINENEITNYLENKGFKTIFLEDLSPEDQALLFNNAKIIIGPHGSGFANLIFAKPKTKIIEIDHGTKEIRSFYKKFSQMLGCYYYPFYADFVTEEHLEDDIIVNIDLFKKFLDKHIN
jgi:capsular polysaccharide biosynthesis protein